MKYTNHMQKLTVCYYWYHKLNKCKCIRASKSQPGKLNWILRILNYIITFERAITYRCTYIKDFSILIFFKSDFNKKKNFIENRFIDIDMVSGAQIINQTTCRCWYYLRFKKKACGTQGLNIKFKKNLLYNWNVTQVIASR